VAAGWPAPAGEVARVLEPGGRFACTAEEGRPGTGQERAQMPGADTIWFIEFTELTGVLREAGLSSDWLGGGRVRKFAMVAEKQ
jgi:hypothetical protein